MAVVRPGRRHSDCPDARGAFETRGPSRPGGAIAVADPIKASTPAALEALLAEGIRILMLTSDNATTAGAIARSLGIADVQAEVMPQDKHRILLEPRAKGDLMGIARARTLSRATMRNIRQKLFFAFVCNAAGVPLAAGVLYPSLGLLLSPIVAAAAMAMSSVSVIGNALRLRGLRL
jgi:Cu+-exporting ATPase